MTFEIGPTHYQRPVQGTPPARPVTPASGPSFEATLQSATGARAATPVRVDRAELSGIPPVPPAEVLDEIGRAADRTDFLAAMNRELHFRQDEETGRVVVEVRDLATGDVVRTIPPSGALAAMSGELEV
jgi:hypothetical protein